MASSKSNTATVTDSVFWAGFRIMRPWNLVIIGGTMWLIRWAWIEPFTSPVLTPWNYFSSVMVMVLLAAGGNVINDYFDITEDLINKPKRALVGRIISRRKTLFLHHFLTGAALSISLALSWHLKSILPLIWSSALAALLWGYSPWFKRRFLRGNIVVAIIVGQLPFWCLLGELTVHSRHVLIQESLIRGLMAYSLLSLYITFVREMIKDVQDAQGDAKAGFDTLPVRWAAQRTRNLVMRLFVLGWVLLGTAAILGSVAFDMGMESLAFLLPYGLSHVQFIRHQTTSVSAWLKMTLGGGLLFLCLFIW